MSKRATAAIILARGLGTRMRQAEAGATLDEDQARAAEAGVKAMIPDARGRPFLDHVLSSLAEGGVTDVCLVIAPEDTAIRAHYLARPPQRVQLAYAIQAFPRGTANALEAAESWAGTRDVLVLNADNLYPTAAVRALVELGEPGLVAFDPVALVREGNIDPARIAFFAILELRGDGTLARIIEKPDARELAAAGPAPWVSMNIWRFDASIFEACRTVPESPRGEYELPQAVSVAINAGMRLRAVRMHEGVLDLSHRGDVQVVATRLAGQDATP